VIRGDALRSARLVSPIARFGVFNGYRLYRRWPRNFRRLWPVRHSAQARLIMIVSVLYVAGAVGITVYMLVALLRPDKF
jgi:hypothetical protein